MQATGLEPHMFEQQGLSLSLDSTALGLFFEHLRTRTPRVSPAQTVPSVLSVFLVEALLDRYVPHGLDTLLLAQLERMVCELLVYADSSVFQRVERALAHHTGSQPNNYEITDPYYCHGLDEVDNHVLRVIRSRPTPVLLTGAASASTVWPPDIMSARCIVAGVDSGTGHLAGARSRSLNTTLVHAPCATEDSQLETICRFHGVWCFV